MATELIKKSIKIDKKIIGEDQPVFVIAEAGVNHNGRLDLALKLVDAAKKAGADAVKFQTWDVEELYVEDKISGKDYQKRSRKRCLPYGTFKQLKKYCQKKKIIFLSTADEEKSIDFLDKLGVPAFKVGSGELPNLPYLKHVAKKQKPIILSTGMGNLNLITQAVKAITKSNPQLVLLHCISGYPTALKKTNLGCIKTLKKKFKKIVGFSDHTSGIEATIIAVALGAKVIEKHFTLSKKLPGVDHKFSLNPQELKSFVKTIRQTEQALNNKKQLSACEKPTKQFAWKSIVAKKDIKKGQPLTLDNLCFKRPGTGITVEKLKMVLNKKAARNIKKGYFISKNDFHP